MIERLIDRHLHGVAVESVCVAGTSPSASREAGFSQVRVIGAAAEDRAKQIDVQWEPRADEGWERDCSVASPTMLRGWSSSSRLATAALRLAAC